jgi:thioredoxin reductase (NADPH)
MTFFSTSERIEIGDIPFVSNHVKPHRSEALEYYRRVAVSNGLKIHLQEEVRDIRKTDKKSNGLTDGLAAGPFEVISSRQTYQAANIVLATGFYDIPVLRHAEGRRRRGQ